MSEASFQRCLAVAWLPENDGQDFHVTPGDPGGATRYGVTFNTFKSWWLVHRKGTPTMDDFMDATLNDLADIVRAWTWQSIHGDALPVGLDLMMFEACFMSGPRAATMCLQNALGVIQDGIFGDQTLFAVHNKCQQTQGLLDLIYHFKDHYEEFLSDLHSAKLFIRGWDRRVDADVKLAESWVAAAAAAIT